MLICFVVFMRNFFEIEGMQTMKNFNLVIYLTYLHLIFLKLRFFFLVNASISCKIDFFFFGYNVHLKSFKCFYRLRIVTLNFRCCIVLSLFSPFEIQWRLVPAMWIDNDGFSRQIHDIPYIRGWKWFAACVTRRGKKNHKMVRLNAFVGDKNQFKLVFPWKFIDKNQFKLVHPWKFIWRPSVKR